MVPKLITALKTRERTSLTRLPKRWQETVTDQMGIMPDRMIITFIFRVWMLELGLVTL